MANTQLHLGAPWIINYYSKVTLLTTIEQEFAMFMSHGFSWGGWQDLCLSELFSRTSLNMTCICLEYKLAVVRNAQLYILIIITTPCTQISDP